MNKKYNKNINAGLASVMALGTVVVAAPMTTEASVNFSDVNTKNQHYNAIINLAERGIIKGFGDGTFKPGQSVTRGQAAKIIAGVLELDTTNVVNPGFVDVPTTNEYYGAIAALENAGIIKGYGDGTFGSGKTVTRNHMAKMIAGAFELEVPAGSTSPFKDVSAESEYSEYIAALYAEGITTGTTKTTFSGASDVTRGQLASFVVRAETTITPEAPTIEEVTFTIDAVENNTVGGYKISDSAKAILNEKNNEALSDALVSVNVRKNEIIAVNSIELNAAGTAEKAIILDGANSAIEKDLTINADHVEVKNVTVKGDVSVTGNVANAFGADGLVGEGQLTIEKGSDALASLVPRFAPNQKGPKVGLKNSDIKNVNVKREGITLESDSKLGEIHISDKVSSIQLNANSGKVVVDATIPLHISGKGMIDEVQLVKAIEVALEISGAIGKLTVDDVKAKIDVATTLIINKIETKGAEIKEIIKNYDQIKENIKEIIGDSEVKPAPTPTPKPSPAPGTTKPGTGTPPGETKPTLATEEEIAVLSDAVAGATALHLNTKEGTEPGEYAEGLKGILLAAIMAADDIAKKEDVTKVEVDKAVADLASAVKVFEDGKVPALTPEKAVNQFESAIKELKSAHVVSTEDEATVKINPAEYEADTKLIPFFQEFLAELDATNATAVKINGSEEIKLDEYDKILQAVNNAVDPVLTTDSTLADLVAVNEFEVTVMLVGGFEQAYTVDFSLDGLDEWKAVNQFEREIQDLKSAGVTSAEGKATVNINSDEYQADTTLIPFFQAFLGDVAKTNATAVKIGGSGELKLNEYGEILKAVNNAVDPDLTTDSTLADLVDATPFNVTVVLEDGFKKTYKVDFSLDGLDEWKAVNQFEREIQNLKSAGVTSAEGKATVKINSNEYQADTTLIPFFQAFLGDVAKTNATAVKIGGSGELKLNEYGEILKAVNNAVDPDLTTDSTLADLVAVNEFEVTVMLAGGFEQAYKVDFALQELTALSTLSMGDNFIIEGGILKFV